MRFYTTMASRFLAFYLPVKCTNKYGIIGNNINGQYTAGNGGELLTGPQYDYNKIPRGNCHETFR